MPQNQEQLPHLRVEGWSRTETYRSKPARGRNIARRPDPGAHGRRILAQLDDVRSRIPDLERRRGAIGVSLGRGAVLEFESDPDTRLCLQSLEDRRAGVELLAVRERDGRQYAAVYVPGDRVQHFANKVTAYLEEQTPTGNPKNRPLVDSIAQVRLAVLHTLWTDPPGQLPSDDSPHWWEVWLRSSDPEEDTAALFTVESAALGVHVRTDQSLRFPDRVVVLARATISQMQDAATLLGRVAELRRPAESPAFFTDLDPVEQAEWVRDLRGRLAPPPPGSPVVCILDTGIDRGHPLLAPVLPEGASFAWLDEWGIHDHDGHGTAMAGLAAYGDLVERLDSVGTVQVEHTLESVKILPPREENDPDLYGSITIDGLAQAEIRDPFVARTVCLAVADEKFRERGRPTSWSGALDDLASGATDGVYRLICAAAGNVPTGAPGEYPARNEAEGIHDPGQAWNVLTVGAFTDKDTVREASHRGWIPVAPRGGLSPYTTTSLDWEPNKWPLKPDLVFEGGNLAQPPGGGDPADLESLHLLTTERRTAARAALLRPMGGTSAAAALCARMAARIQGAYPDLWPETVRALLVHSAEWTPAMRAMLPRRFNKFHVGLLVRRCGFGVPDSRRALYSARNALTLIVEETLQPFDREGSRPVMRDMHLHPLPWPTEALLENPTMPVELRVTLSYFVEPSPGQRGWAYKHRYASHGLRFDVKGETESPERFRHRINEYARQEEDGRRVQVKDDRWTLGKDLRSLGSIHRDSWSGTAAELAERGMIGVFPVVGWWRERPDQGRWDKSARYSLVVSISTPVQGVDVYAPVAVKLGVPVPVAVEA